MPILKVENVAEHGIISDVLPYQLPPNAWTSGQNVTFRDNKVQKFKGHSEYYDTGLDWDGGIDERIYWVLPVAEAGSYYWIYCGLKDVKVYDKASDTAKEITRSGDDYSGTADLNWTGGIITGIPILNNGVDEPQMWNPVDFGTPQLLTDITGWPAGDFCSSMRVYKNYLIAMDVTKSDTRIPAMVKWSDGAAIGAVPQSWDEADPTTDAGENDLAEGRGDINVGAVIDGASLRDSFMIYKDDSVWRMDFTGGNEIFTFRQVLKTTGLLTRRCIAEFEGKHFFVSNADVMVTDGNSAQSVIDSRRRRFLFSDMDGNNYQRTFVFACYPENEMWICYPQTDGYGMPDKALVWNWRHNTWGHRDLPNDPTASTGWGVGHIYGGVVDTSNVVGDLWSTDDGNWDTWTVPWGSISFNPQNQSPLIAANKMYRGDVTDQFDGSNFTSRIERIGLPMSEQGEMVRIKRIFPRMDGSAAVNISVGVQLNPGAGVDYSSAVSFTPGTDNKIDVRKTGTHMAIKFESTGNQEWSLSGYDVEYEIVSQRAG